MLDVRSCLAQTTLVDVELVIGVVLAQVHIFFVDHSVTADCCFCRCHGELALLRGLPGCGLSAAPEERTFSETDPLFFYFDVLSRLPPLFSFVQVRCFMLFMVLDAAFFVCRNLAIIKYVAASCQGA